MSQDSGKDKRPKVISLTVRYKSATVDDFIENHSQDVSKSGLFVKTAKPFPPGTLLKFEVRIAGDTSLISGVGRVVWKREPPEARADKPAGMGVKFIKLEAPSQAVIDRLVAQKANAGSAYTSEEAVDEAPPGHPSTFRGLVAAAPPGAAAAPGPRATEGGPKPIATGSQPRLPAPPPSAPGSQPRLPAPPPSAPGSKPVIAAISAKLPAARPAPAPPGELGAPAARVAPPPATARPAPGAMRSATAVPAPKPSERKLPAPLPRVAIARKATMMGMPAGAGTPGPAPVAEDEPPAAVAEPPPAEAAAPMFPSFDPPASKPPVREQSVMMRAADLLQEALKEAAGSFDEIGQNSLFGGYGGGYGELSLHERRPTSAPGQSGGTLIMPAPAAGDQPSPLGTDPPPPPGFGGLDPSAPSITAVARAVSLSSHPGSATAAGPAPVPAALALAFAPAPAVPAPPPAKDGGKVKKGAGGDPLTAVLFLLIVGVGLFEAYRTGSLAAIGGPAPVTPSALPNATTASPPLSAPPSGSSAALMATGDSGPAPTDATAASTTTDAGASIGSDPDAAVDSGTGKDTGTVGARTTPPPGPDQPRTVPHPRPQAQPPTGEAPASTGEAPARPRAPARAPVPKPPAPAPARKPSADEL